MSTDKRFDRICAIVMAAALVMTILFMNGGALGLQAVADEDTDANEGNSYFTENDLDGSWDDSGATVIELKGDTASIKGTGAYFNDGDVVIRNGGWYVISGELTDGSIIVDAYKSSKVWIRLNGVTVNCGDDSAFIVSQADKVFLTLAEGSENSFTDAAEYSEGGRNAAVYSKDDLTINGSGSLTVTGNYKHGIKCNDDLVITGGTISVTCPQDGIHANDSLHLTGADITIEAGDDAVHCDTEIYYADGSLLITSCYEGIEAPEIEIAGGDIVIYASDDGINANGGTGSSMGMMGGMPLMGTGAGTQGGTAEDAGNAGEDAEAEDSGEDPEAKDSGDDAEAKDAGDDAEVEDAGDDAESENTELATVRITGGNITVINENGRDADGIDSNGDIVIEGGNVLVSLADGGGNNALDYGSESGGRLIINGGTMLAAASSSMLEGVSEDSEQCSVIYMPETGVEAGTVVQVKDADSNILMEKEVPCSFSAIIISSPDFQQGETYTVVTGETEKELTIDSVTVTVGSAAGGMGMTMQGRQGGFDNGGRHQGFEAENAAEGMENMSELSEEDREHVMQNMEQMRSPQGGMQAPESGTQATQNETGQLKEDTETASEVSTGDGAEETAEAGVEDSQVPAGDLSGNEAGSQNRTMGRGKYVRRRHTRNGR